MTVVTSAKKLAQLSQAANPKLALISAVGDLTREEVLSDLVLVATYIRPEKTAGGIIRPIDNIKEDELQGKVGLILKMGPQATEYTDDTPATCQVGDWVVYDIKAGWAVTINEVACRLVPYARLRMRISSPDVVF